MYPTEMSDGYNSPMEDTIDRTDVRGDPSGHPAPGVVLVFCSGRPVLQAFPCGPNPGATLIIGRSTDVDVTIHDARLSRQHAELRWSGESWSVRDLGSHNGTFVDGKPVEGGG